MVRAAQRSARTSAPGGARGAERAGSGDGGPIDPVAGPRRAAVGLGAALGGRLPTLRTGPLTGRSMLGAALVVFSVGTVLAAHRAAVAPAGEQVVVLAADARSGSTLQAEDLLLVRMELPLEVASIPGADASGLVGAAVTRDLQRGAVLTPSDVTSTGVDVTGSIRVTLATDPERTPAGLRAGERVDVLSTDLERGTTDVLVAGATVTGTTLAEDASFGDGGPTTVELAVPDRERAAAVVDASVRHEVTLVLPAASSGAGASSGPGSTAPGSSEPGPQPGPASDQPDESDG